MTEFMSAYIGEGIISEAKRMTVILIILQSQTISRIGAMLLPPYAGIMFSLITYSATQPYSTTVIRGVFIQKI